MKKVLSLFVAVCFVFAATALYAGQDYPLGHNSVDVKVHHFAFYGELYRDSPDAVTHPHLLYLARYTDLYRLHLKHR